MSSMKLAQAGFGLGLRVQHYPHIFEHRPSIDWFEIISENFMDSEGRPRRNLERVLEHYPVVMHGVSLSIGTVDPLNSEYLRKLKSLIKLAKPLWLSDHLCWTGVAHRNTHDLLPVPYTEQALKHVVSRIRQVQDYLGLPIALENPSTYLDFQSSSMPEAEFIARMVEQSGCHLLLDVNNVHVTCFNHRLDVQAYLDALPMERVIQIHLAGHSHRGTHIIDTHDDHVSDAVWTLYQQVLQRAGRMVNTMIEWDDRIPEFPVLAAELNKARQLAAQVNKAEVTKQVVQPDGAAVTPWVSTTKAVLELKAAQHHMQQAIIAGRGFDSNPAQWIRHNDSLPPQAQLDVYINAYRWRLREVVAEDYPVLAHYLGKDLFARLIEDFVEKETPDHYHIGRFALKLPAFLRSHRPEDVFAHELCELETAIAQLLDAEETPVLDVAMLNGLTAEGFMSAVLLPRKALQLVAFDFAVNDYFQSVQDEQPLAPPTRQATFLAVFRHEDRVWRMPLAADEHGLLAQLVAGVPVAEAIDSLAGDADALVASVSDWFARWVRNGLISAVRPATTRQWSAAV